MKKVIVLGAKKDHENVLEKLQSLGVVHIAKANVEEVKLRDELVLQQDKIVRTLSILSSYSKESVQKEEYPDHLCETVIDCQNKLAKLKEEKKDIEERLNNLSPWGEISTEEWNTLERNKVFIKFCKIATTNLKKVSPDVIAYKKIVANVAFFAIISRDKEPEIPENATEIVIKEGTVELRNRLENNTLQTKATESVIQKNTVYCDALQKYNNSIIDKISLQKAGNKLFYQKDIFALKGFLPITKVEEFQKELENISVALYIENPAEDDDPPTLIENPKWVQSVVDIVKLYATPGYKEWDSSASIYFGFTIFFAMIVGDAGYGSILLAMMLALRGKLKNAEIGQRVYRLMVTLSIGCIVFGAISGNWFAIELSENNPLKSLHILGASKNSDENLSNMMTLSIYIGAIHLSIARLIQIIRIFPSSLFINQIGWLVMMWGAIAKLAWQNEYGLHIMLGGAILAVLFASNSRNLFKRLALGFADLLGVTQNFSDVLSYLRLFALGLASTVMAKIFNDLGMQIREVAVVGPVLMVFVIFMGHTINLLLAVMGGFIHGLRLNFLEFYRYCFEGTGYDYQPFTKKS